LRRPCLPSAASKLADRSRRVVRVMRSAQSNLTCGGQLKLRRLVWQSPAADGCRGDGKTGGLQRSKLVQGVKHQGHKMVAATVSGVIENV
jgi:hypothetical protein